MPRTAGYTRSQSGVIRILTEEGLRLAASYPQVAEQFRDIEISTEAIAAKYAEVVRLPLDHPNGVKAVVSIAARSLITPDEWEELVHFDSTKINLRLTNKTFLV